MTINRLFKETSPYLKQHENNPVDWYPWTKEALDKAKKEKKPILLSIGYSACHWCHVMAHESFEDSYVADIMNNHFICVKVDREDGDGGGAKAEGCVLAWCLAPSSPFPHAFVESCWHICAPSGCAPRRWNRKQQPRSRRQPPLDLMLTRTTQLSSSAPTTTW